MKAAGHTSVELTMIADRNHATIVPRIGSEGDVTTEQVLRFVSRERT